MKGHGKTIFSLILILISVSLFFYKFNIREIMAVVNLIPVYVILLVLLLHIITLVLGSYKWYLMLAGIDHHRKMGLIFKIHISTIYFDNITPGAKMGGEGVRLYMMRRLAGTDYASVTGLIGLDKVTSMLPFIAMCIIAFAWQWSNFYKSLLGRWIFIVLFFLTLIILTATAALLKLGRKGRGFNEIKPSRLKLFLASAGHAFREVFTRKREVFPLLFLSSIIWFSYLLKMYILARAIGIKIPFGILSSASILAYLVGMLPLTPGGLGFFDGTIGGILLLFNVNELAIGTLVFLYRLTTYFFTLLLGGIASIALFNKVSEKKKLSMREDL